MIRAFVSDDLVRVGHRPIRRKRQRAAVEEFKQRHYGRYAGQEQRQAPLVTVPPDHAARVKDLRQQSDSE